MSTTEASDRNSAIARAAKQWTDQLIDTSGNNKLLFYRSLKVGTLDFSADQDRIDAGQLGQMTTGTSVRLSHLFPHPDDQAAAAKKLRAISAKAIENEEERGISTLFLAWGMATWTGAGVHGPVPNAPVFLLPVTANRRLTSGNDYDLQVDGDTELNPTLVHYLETELGTKVDPALVLNAAGAGEAPLADPDAGLAELLTTCREVPGFSVEAHAVIGNFSFAKLPMVKDIQQNAEALAAHGIIAALAGVGEAQADLRAQVSDVDLTLPDRTPPENEFLILDADASQNYAINRVLAGESLVIQGPPGTGKSQTIANLIAAAVATGKKVLFVAEKRAAIDAVMSRLDRQGLKDLVLDLHSQASSRPEIMRALGAAMDAAGAIAEPKLSELHTALTTNRAALVAHDEALHRKRTPWDISVHDLITELSAVPNHLRSTTRLVPSVLRSIDRDALSHRTTDLREYVTIRREDGPPHFGSWAGASFTSVTECQDALGAAAEAFAAWNRLAPEIERATADMGLSQVSTAKELTTLIELCKTGEYLRSRLGPDAIGSDELMSVAEGLQSGTGVFSRRKAPYKTAKQTALAMAAPELDDFTVLSQAIFDGAELQTRWFETYGTQVRLPINSAQLVDRATEFGTALLATESVVAPDTFAADDIEVVVERLRSLANSTDTLFRQPRLRELESSLSGCGLNAVVQETVDHNLSPDESGMLLGHTWLRSIYELEAPSEFGAFSGPLMDDRVRTFQNSDREHLTKTALRVRRAAARYAVAARDANPEQSQFLANQVRRKRGIRPVRELFRNAPDVMLGLKPCWTMSPLLVAQMLPGDRQYFDLVIFDEASQVKPADAVSAILRAPQLVVAGDSRQLPPTTFFATETAADLEEEDDDEAMDLSVATGFESVLDAAAALMRPAYLGWHYRSRDERLIAFSNAHIYDSRLTTFPGIAGDRCLSHVLVDPTIPDAEVEAVTDLVLEHARTRPEESLGVIAMGIKHAERVNEAIRVAVAGSSDKVALDRFFNETADERFFVKNLERVQGDERDAIILTTGYGPGPDGHMRYAFGPLNQEGGERRLNVAISRARSTMTMVSGFQADDLDPARTTSKGADLLRRFLRYIEGQGSDLGLAGAVPVEMNPFEIEVRDALEARGIPLQPQYGVSGYRLDFAAAHPDKPGRLVLAIECDGASYHSSQTARDRDRLRQNVLEQLGWRFHRIWSTDWFRDPQGSADRVLEAWKEAVRRSDIDDTQAPSHPAADAETHDEAGGPPDEAFESEPGQPTRSGPKPVRGRGRPINEYQHHQLDALIRWIRSDTLLRTREQLVTEAISQLGFKRRGARIVSAIEAAIDRSG